MRESVPFLVTVGVLAAVMGGFAWLAARVRRRGLAGTAVRAALASYDEAFHATAHESHYELRAQAERRVPAPSPDGKWTPRDDRRAERSASRGELTGSARGPRSRRSGISPVRRVRAALRRRSTRTNRP